MIKFYTLEQSEEWDAIVKSFENYDVYYLSGYVRAFALHGDGEPMLVYFESKQKPKTRAINVIIRRDVADQDEFKGILNKGEYFDSTTPYGYGGFIISGEDYKSLGEEYAKFCNKQNIISEFVRFHPLLENWNNLQEIYDIEFLGNTVKMKLENESQIWENLIGKNRNMIRKAKKNGLQVFWERSPKIVDEFISIYNETMDNDKASEYYYFEKEFYESILFDLKYNALWFYVKKGNNILASSIILTSNGKMHYHLSGSKKEYRSLAATNLLLYEVACWGVSNGYKVFHLGGGLGAKEDSLYKFKKAFNRQEDSKFYIGKKIWNQKKYDYLVSLRDKFDKGSNFFPLYRCK